MSDYNGFNYEEFHEFIVDFFEADQSIEGIAAAAELLNWWNRYVSDSKSHSGPSADIFPGRCSQNPPQHEQPHPRLCDEIHLRC